MRFLMKISGRDERNYANLDPSVKSVAALSDTIDLEISNSIMNVKLLNMPDNNISDIAMNEYEWK